MGFYRADSYLVDLSDRVVIKSCSYQTDEATIAESIE